MRIIRAAECRRMPWKNGGGETTEIAVHPPGADFEAMDWRLSMARVTADGPFSCFPGIERTLSVLSGTLRLVIDGAAVDLMETSPPHTFPGEARTEGVVVRGPVSDLNVMTRRESLRHDVRRVAVVGETTLSVGAGTRLVFCRSGAVTLPGGQSLAAGDTAVDEAADGALTLTSAAPSIVYVVTISPR
jgi:uncharacterized protein